MTRPAALIRRTLIFVHRWLGVALSILFFIWFASGIVMMYWSFPSVSPQDRRERAVTLTAELLNVSPEEAYAALERERPPAQIRVTSFDGRPVYQFGGGGGRGGGASMVYADDGTVRTPADRAMVDRAAAAWARRPVGDATRESIEKTDQWTVAGQLRSLRPLYKYSFSDGQQVYVDGTTADVVQYTTRESRVWAYLGAIPHWMYFTPLRVHQQQWFSFVVWTSGIGTVAALLGVVVAVWMYSPRQRYRYAGAPTSIPYRGWKRWHTILGLFFGVVTTTWAFSGLLSMGPFPILDRITELTVPAGEEPPDVDIAGALRGAGRLPLSAFTDPPAAALAALRGFETKELEFSQFDGRPVYLATNATGETRVVPMHGAPGTTFDPDDVMRIVRAAAGPHLADLRLLTQYDAYYLDRRREAPLPVVYARLNDAASTRVYVDPATARIVRTYNARNWISRWAYHGLHSLDFPWLYNYRPLWDIVVITLMLGGTAVCVTSLVLTYRVLARKVTTLVRPLATQPTDDITPG